MKNDSNTTGVNFQMENNLYRRMKIKLAMDNDESMKDYITHLIERDLNADKRIPK